MVRVVVQIHLHPFIGHNVYRHIGSQNLNCNIRVCLLKQRSAGIYTIHLIITAKDHNTRFPMSHVKRGVVEVILWLNGKEKPKA